MKKPTLLFAALIGACSSDTTDSGVAKVDIDDPTEVIDPDGDGASNVAVEGDVASVAFTLGEPLPEISFRKDGTEDAAVMDVVAALSVVVSSPRSGISVSLADDGELVAGPPSGVGEWSVELSDDRTEFTISWFNETRGGLTMKPGEPYDAVYSLDDNCCIDAIPDTTMPVKVD